MSKAIFVKVRACLAVAVFLMLFFNTGTVSAVTTTLDVVPTDAEVVPGDPYSGSGSDFFGDMYPQFAPPFPASSGVVGESGLSGDGFDLAFLVPGPEAACTSRVFNGATLEFQVLQDDGGRSLGFGIGLSTDVGTTFDTSGVFSANLDDALFTAGFGVGVQAAADGIVTSTHNFTTPVPFTPDMRYILGVQADNTTPGTPTEYEITNLTFSVTDDCPPPPPVETNVAPVAKDDTFVANMNTEEVVINVLDGSAGGSDSDLDGDELLVTSVSIVSGDLQGEVAVIDESNISYMPSNGFFGVTVIDYSISDNNGHVAGATITVTVNEILAETGVPVIANLIVGLVLIVTSKTLFIVSRKPHRITA